MRTRIKGVLGEAWRERDTRSLRRSECVLGVIPRVSVMDSMVLRAAFNLIFVSMTSRSTSFSTSLRDGWMDRHALKGLYFKFPEKRSGHFSKGKILGCLELCPNASK